MEPELLTIGAMSERTGVATSALRFYETQGTTAFESCSTPLGVNLDPPALPAPGRRRQGSQSASGRPEARAMGRVTAARTESSGPTTVRCFSARVTAV